MTNLIHIKMNIKEITDKSLDFAVKRVSEIFGITLIIVAVLLLTSLSSYSPEDPNFIFQNNSKIKNLLGFQGSYVSDLFLQTIGLISFLVPISLFFTGINIFKSKNILLFLDNLFFIIVYCIFGSLFFSYFYSKSFWLVINGNGGFVGNFISDGFLGNLINLNENITYYLLIIILIILFFISVNFNLKTMNNFFKFIANLLKNKKKNLTFSPDISEQDLKTDEVKNEKLIQEDLPFKSNTEDKKNISKKFKFPTIDFLNLPSKKESDKNLSKSNIDETFLEKILLDFGVEGKIKKVSRGPVVTLNEFEPAAGINAAIGLLETDMQYEFTRSAPLVLASAKNEDFNRINKALNELEELCRKRLSADGISKKNQKINRIAECRYHGQGFELRAEIPSGKLTNANKQIVIDNFHKQHELDYGYTFGSDQVEIMTLRVVGIASVEPMSWPKQKKIQKTTTMKKSLDQAYLYTRKTTFDDGKTIDTPRFDRDKMLAGHKIKGPAIIIQHNSTTLIPPGYLANVSTYGNIHIKK